MQVAAHQLRVLAFMATSTVVPPLRATLIGAFRGGDGVMGRETSRDGRVTALSRGRHAAAGGRHTVVERGGAQAETVLQRGLATGSGRGEEEQQGQVSSTRAARGSSRRPPPRRIARVWSGVVPQQPPTMATPRSSSSGTRAAIVSGVSS